MLQHRRLRLRTHHLRLRFPPKRTRIRSRHDRRVHAARQHQAFWTQIQRARPKRARDGVIPQHHHDQQRIRLHHAPQRAHRRLTTSRRAIRTAARDAPVRGIIIVVMMRADDRPARRVVIPGGRHGREHRRRRQRGRHARHRCRRRRRRRRRRAIDRQRASLVARANAVRATPNTSVVGHRWDIAAVRDWSFSPKLGDSSGHTRTTTTTRLRYDGLLGYWAAARRADAVARRRRARGVWVRRYASSSSTASAAARSRWVLAPRGSAVSTKRAVLAHATATMAAPRASTGLGTV